MEEPSFVQFLAMYPLGALYLLVMAFLFSHVLDVSLYLLFRALPVLLWMVYRFLCALFRWVFRRMQSEKERAKEDERARQEQQRAEEQRRQREQREQREQHEQRQQHQQRRRADEDRQHRRKAPPHNRGEPDALARACSLLGLSKGAFNKAELGRAYRNAIRKAHPDAGDNPELATRINCARDLIRQHYGWA